MMMGWWLLRIRWAPRGKKIRFSHCQHDFLKANWRPRSGRIRLGGAGGGRWGRDKEYNLEYAWEGTRAWKWVLWEIVDDQWLCKFCGFMLWQHGNGAGSGRRERMETILILLMGFYYSVKRNITVMGFAGWGSYFWWVEWRVCKTTNVWSCHINEIPLNGVTFDSWVTCNSSQNFDLILRDIDKHWGLFRTNQKKPCDW